MFTRKRFLLALVVVLASPIAQGVLLKPAQADGYCSRQAVCMWEDNRYRGDLYVKQNQPPRERCDVTLIYDIDGFNGDNEISSVDNATDFDVVLFADDDGQGATLVIPEHQRYYGVGSFDNDAESYAFRC